MYYNGDIKFKGVSSKAFPLIITAVPTVSHSEIRGNVYSVPGRGDLYDRSTYRGSATVTVLMALVADDSVADGVSAYQEPYRAVRKWLQGTGRLIISDSSDSYYEVQRVTINTDSRVILNYGNIEVAFTVYPYEFMETGDEVAELEEGVLVNDCDPSMPLYKIEGSGSGTLTVNDKAMSFEVEDTLYIDTRKYIAYDQLNANKSSSLSGDYEDITLLSGNNEISITSGFDLSVYPRWGYVI